MNFVKNSLFKILIAIALIVSLAICGYRVYNYSSNSNNSSNSFNGFNGNHGFGQRPNTTPQEGTGQNSGNANGSSNNNQQDNGNKSASNGGNSFNNGVGNQQGPNGSFTRMGGSSEGSNYSSYFYVYGGVFLCLFIAGMYCLVRKKSKINPMNEKILIFSFLAIGLLLRISLATLIAGHPGDINIFKGWATSVSSNLTNFYVNTRMSDYPPFYMYVLFIIGSLAKMSALSKYYVILIKLPSIIADIVSAYLIYRIGEKHISTELSVLLALFYLFNPAVFINSTVWGQVDSFFALVLIIGLFLLAEKKLVLSSIIFTIAVLMKPQGIIFLPVMFFELVRQKKLKNFALAIVTALFTALIIVIPFSAGRNITWIFNLYASTVSEYPYATINGFNFFYLIGANYVKDTTNFIFADYHVIGMIFIVLTTLVSWFVYHKGKNLKYIFLVALIQIAGVFTFSVGMHERYLFPAVILAIIAFIYMKDKRLILLAVGFSITVYLNTHTVLFQALGGNMRGDGNSFVGFVCSALNIALFIYLIKIAFDNCYSKKISEQNDLKDIEYENRLN